VVILATGKLKDSEWYLSVDYFILLDGSWSSN